VGPAKGGPFVAGAARTVIGVGVGAAYALGAGLVLRALAGAMPLFLLGLIPMRLVEWALLLKLLYLRDTPLQALPRRPIAVGTVFSFVLDLPAILGLITAGKLWIC
jgi:hypothetical protein